MDMAIGFKQLVSAANAEIQTRSLDEAKALADDANVQFVDVRDGHEVRQSGMLPGAFHASRGFLEFMIDPESPMHKDEFSSGKTLVFYCATGGRSALATKLAQDMGVANVSHIAGGFKAWSESGATVEPWSDD